MMGMAEKGGKRKRGKGTKDWPDIAAMYIVEVQPQKILGQEKCLLLVVCATNKYWTTFKCG